jgi:hypothetical protein
MSDLREVEVLLSNDEWVTIEFRYLNVGDQFRLIESTGEYVEFKGKTVFTVRTEPTPNENGVYGVEIEE